MNNNNRIFGLEALRLLAMLMVVTLHVLMGGVLESSSPLSLNYNIAHFMKIMCQCAVNCFALLSGYVGIKGKYKYANICILWLKVLVYTVGITGIFALIGSHSISLKTFIKACMPVFNGEYWYFIAYFALFLIMPVLNSATEKLTYKQHLILIGSWILFFSILPTLFMKDPFVLVDGYSVWWLMILYMVGSFVAKYETKILVKRYYWAMLYVVSVVIAFLFKVVVEYFSFTFISGNMLAGYTSPLMVSAAFGLLMFFKDMKMNDAIGKIIVTLAACTFGVYIIHRNGIFWDAFISGKTAELGTANVFVLIVIVLLRVLVIFSICGLVDFVLGSMIKKSGIKKSLLKIEGRLF